MRWKFYTRLLLAMAMKFAVGDEQEAESESHYETGAKGPTSMRQENPGCGLSKWNKKDYPCDKKMGNNYACSARRGLKDHQYSSCWRSCDESGTYECIEHSQKDQWCWARGEHPNDSCKNHEDCQWAAAAPCQPCGLSTWNKQGYPCDQRSGNNYGCSASRGSELHQYYYCWRSCDDADETGTDECIKHSQKTEYCWARGKYIDGSCSTHENCKWAAAGQCQPFTGV